MSIFDRFKKLVGISKRERKVKAEKKIEKELMREKRKKEISTKIPFQKVLEKKVTKPTKEASWIYSIIKEPIISEKAQDASELGKYIFKVAEGANKTEIKKAIENLYGIKVVGVNIINIPRKERRLGRSIGYKPGWKKAVVTLEPGQKIEIGAR